MAHYEVTVQWYGGTPAAGQSVSIGVSDGVTDKAYTDSRGVAVISTSGHYSTATVYVGGSEYGTMGPGRKVVTLRG